MLRYMYLSHKICVSLETISSVTGTVTKYIFCSLKSQGTIKKLRKENSLFILKSHTLFVLQAFKVKND